MKFCRTPLLALIVLTVPSQAAEPTCVTAERLIATARSALVDLASKSGIAAQFESAGRVQDLCMPIDGEPQLTADIQQAPWLRPRVGVPVHVRLGDRHTSAMVWFSVSALVPGEVYVSDFPRGTNGSAILHRPGTVDLARTKGEAMPEPATLPRLRLRHAIRAGDPMRAGDFEPTPTVSAQQYVRIEANRGAVRLSTRGRALTDGNVGQTISVLPARATRPVSARIVSPSVVTIENP